MGQWDAMPMVRRLRAIHVAAAFAMLYLTLLIATGARGPSGTTIALLTVAVAVLVGCLALLCAPALLDATEARVTDRVTSALQATACGLTVVTVAAVVLDRTPWPLRASEQESAHPHAVRRYHRTLLVLPAHAVRG